MNSKFNIFIMSMALAVGFASPHMVAMELQSNSFDFQEFTDYLFAINSYEEFKEYLQESDNTPVTKEDKIYCALYIAARYGLENEKSLLDESIMVNLPNEKISLEKEDIFLGEYTLNTQKLWQALKNAYYIAYRNQHWDWCSRIAYLLTRFDAMLDQEMSDSYLRTALQHNDMILFEALLAVTQDINAVDTHGTTILNAAIVAGNASAVKILCGHGAKITLPLPNGQSSLQEAYEFYKDLQDNQEDTSAYMEIIAELLAQPGVNIAQAIDAASGRMPLHAAVEVEGVDAVRALLAYPTIDVNCGARHNLTPLHFAINQDHEEIIKLLLSHPAINPNCCWGDEDNTALHLAAENGSVALVQHMVQHKALSIHDRNNQQLSALDTVIMRIHSGLDDEGNELSEELLQYMYASAALLMRFGAYPQLSPMTPLSQATREVLPKILPPAFIYALQNPKHNALSTSTIDPHEKDCYGATLLMYMVAAGEVEAVEYLLKLGASVYTLDCFENHEFSIVHTLIEQRNYAVIEIKKRVQEARDNIKNATTLDEKDELLSTIKEGAELIQALEAELANYQRILTLLEDASVTSILTKDVDDDATPSDITKDVAVAGAPSVLRRNAMLGVLGQDITYLDTLPNELLLLLLGYVFGNHSK